MGVDQTRNNPYYQKPQKPNELGTPNLAPKTWTPGLGSNTGAPVSAYTTQPTAPAPQQTQTYNPLNKGKQLRDAAAAAGTAMHPSNPYGSESGNTYLEDRYLARLNGTDPAFNYALKRGNEELGNRYAGAGAYNSGAARQGESDMYANLMAQSQGQLDALAAGATGAHQNKLNSMFSHGLGLAGGESGINSAYDLAAGGVMSDALKAALGYGVNKAGVESQSTQQGLGNITGILSMIYGGGALANKGK